LDGGTVWVTSTGEGSGVGSTKLVVSTELLELEDELLEEDEDDDDDDDEEEVDVTDDEEAELDCD